MHKYSQATLFYVLDLNFTKKFVVEVFTLHTHNKGAGDSFKKKVCSFILHCKYLKMSEL